MAAAVTVRIPWPPAVAALIAGGRAPVGGFLAGMGEVEAKAKKAFDNGAAFVELTLDGKVVGRLFVNLRYQTFRNGAWVDLAK